MNVGVSTTHTFLMIVPITFSLAIEGIVQKKMKSPFFHSRKEPLTIHLESQQSILLVLCMQDHLHSYLGHHQSSSSSYLYGRLHLNLTC